MNSYEYDLIMKSKRLINSNSLIDREKGFDILNQMAKKQNRNALYELGLLYHDGTKIEKNVSKACNLFLFSGDLGNENAYYELGKIYLYEFKYYENAKRYFMKCKHQKDALFELGIMASKGKGFALSKHKAFTFFLESSKLGCKEADYKLAEYYFNGEGIKQNLFKGKYYLSRALRKGVVDKYDLSSRIKISQN